MGYFLMVVLGLLGGGTCVFVALAQQRKSLAETRQQQEAHRKEISETLDNIRERERKLQEFEIRVVTYSELQEENVILKRDLRNIAGNVRKLTFERDLQRQSQEKTDRIVKEFGSRYLKDAVKWVAQSLNPNNYAGCRQRLLDVIEWCRGIGFQVTQDEQAAYVADLRADYELVVRAAFEREEQARIKAQIREEQKREREIQREQERIDRERAVLQAALEKALAEARDEHSAEIESLKARLAEAEEKQRAMSQAQLTKSGYVYVISNIGSFGDGVFKVGMTRRLEPLERIRELGDASVPFPFDVHMMISTDDAPSLETALHKALYKRQVNKTNPRKEFFRTDIDSIVELVHENHGEVAYRADAEALEYRQSLSMPDEDQQFIEHVYEELDESDEGVDGHP
jgi:hypothetical protein